MKISKIGKQLEREDFKVAMATGDFPEIVNYLRGLNEPLPVELVHLLADALDPAKVRKTGPKPVAKSSKKQHRRFMRDFFLITLHMDLAMDREFARYMLNSDKESFEINNSDDLFVQWKFTPDWKYPHAERKRNQKGYPNRGEIEEFVCKRGNISKSTYGPIIKAHREKGLLAVSCG